MLTRKKAAVREKGGLGGIWALFEWNGNKKVGAGIR
jgi:hypothetical protein